MAPHLKKPGVIVLGVVNNLPQFGEVVDVYVLGTNRFHLYVRILDTQHFNHHSHCYIVCRSVSFKLISPNDLYTHSILHLRSLSSTELVVIPKYHIYNSVYTIV